MNTGFAFGPDCSWGDPPFRTRLFLLSRLCVPVMRIPLQQSLRASSRESLALSRFESRWSAIFPSNSLFYFGTCLGTFGTMDHPILHSGAVVGSFPLPLSRSFPHPSEILESTVPVRLREVLGDLCHLFNLHSIENSATELLESGYLSAEQLGMLRTQVRCLLVKVRPNALALVDAFNFSDQYLNSCIGRYDGRIYDALYERAKADPLNHQPVVSPFTGAALSSSQVRLS